MNPQLDGQSIFDKAGKNIQWKRQSLEEMLLEENGQQHAKD